MSRQLLAVALLSAIVSACSSEPLEPSTEQTTEVGQLGSISLPLTTVAGGATYRLTLAQFTISGEALAKKPRIVKPLPDVPVHTEALPVGTYSVLLEKGWVLERKGSAAGEVFKPITAQLVTPNPLNFDVASLGVTDALFSFVTAAGDVSLGNGSVNIRIGVQDCSAYDAYTAALATLTVDCLGTINANSYAVTKDGIISRTFDKCVLDETRLLPIDQLLTVQFRTARLPYAKECIAGRYAAFKAKFDQSGIVACPQWKKDRTVNPINIDVISKLIPELPQLPAADNGPLRVMGQLKENNLYVASFPQAPVGNKCDGPGACAVACAAGFPGFVISNDGPLVLTDPPAWLLDTEYTSSTSDPYLKLGYYHPMSYYGGVPGVAFGAASRYEPCPGCLPEMCSYYTGVHVKLPLKLDCLIPGDSTTCLSYCSL